MDKIQIKTEKINDCMIGTTRLIVNDKEIQNLISAKFEISVDSVPTLFCEIAGMSDIEAFGCAIIDPSPTNLQESCRIISEELKKHGDFYDAFVASINSVLSQGIQCEPPDLMKSKAEQIVNRIIGEE